MAEPGTHTDSSQQTHEAKRIMERKVEIIEGCIICKTCEFTCPDVFEVEEKSLTAKVIDPHPPEDLLPRINEAIRNCPENVIKFKRQASPDKQG
jgi:ferredoxin